MEALRGVIDPEIGLNIVDLGLVYQIDFDEETNEIFLAMTLTTQFCPMGESIRDSAESVMQDAFAAYRVIQRKDRPVFHYTAWLQLKRAPIGGWRQE